MAEPKLNAENLRAELDSLAQRGSAYLRRYAWKVAMEKGLQRMLTISMAVPIAMLVGVLTSVLSGVSLWPLGVVPTILLAVLVPVLVVLIFSTFAWFQHKVDRRLSLALFDRELGLQDRLQTADEFLSKTEVSAFEAAAIEDAKEVSVVASQRGPWTSSSCWTDADNESMDAWCDCTIRAGGRSSVEQLASRPSGKEYGDH